MAQTQSSPQAVPHHHDAKFKPETLAHVTDFHAHSLALMTIGLAKDGVAIIDKRSIRRLWGCTKISKEIYRAMEKHFPPDTSPDNVHYFNLGEFLYLVDVSKAENFTVLTEQVKKPVTS